MTISKTSQKDQEFEAMRLIYASLEPLDDEARMRIVNYVVARLDIATEHDDEQVPNTPMEPEVLLKQEQGQARKFSSFSELHDATQPRTNGDKALIAGYWLQVCQGQEDFDGQSANTELKHLGEGIANITVAINGLKSQKPALVIQLKKSGKSQQSRKTYKVTVGGIRAVDAMLNA